MFDGHFCKCKLPILLGAHMDFPLNFLAKIVGPAVLLSFVKTTEGPGCSKVKKLILDQI